MHQLAFTRAHSYAGRDAGITLPVVLRSGAKFADLVASLDTGASHCLFESGYARELGLVRVGLVDHDREIFLAAHDRE